MFTCFNAYAFKDNYTSDDSYQLNSWGGSREIASLTKNTDGNEAIKITGVLNSNGGATTRNIKVKVTGIQPYNTGIQFDVNFSMPDYKILNSRSSATAVVDTIIDGSTDTESQSSDAQIAVTYFGEKRLEAKTASIYLSNTYVSGYWFASAEDCN